MPVAVISDVHGNLEALDAALADIKKRKVRKILFLGDAVGYGPDPNGCIETLFENANALIAGNHDRAAIGLTDIEYFNENAKAAIIWTESVLTKKNREALGGLQILKAMGKEGFFLVHSTPKEPEQWHYLLTLFDAETNFDFFEQRLCLLGHSHMPFIIERLPSGEMITHRAGAALNGLNRYIINVGSVGQPRDGDSRAAYALLYEERAEIVRVQYDIGRTQRKMREAGLPLPLIERLSRGK
jgi:predicted phosphodiesterase